MDKGSIGMSFDSSKEPLVKEKGAISSKTQATLDKAKDKPMLPLSIDTSKEPSVKEKGAISEKKHKHNQLCRNLWTKEALECLLTVLKNHW